MTAKSMFWEAAEDYLSRGVAVIPIEPGGKRPVTKHGLNDWTDNPDQLVVWWGQTPNLNVAGVLGTVSGGLFAIDLDVHEEGHSGIETLREWERVHGELPETWTSITGSGGKQLFYRTGREVRNSANAELGVDVRGNGGYVVLPPSIHPCGEPYEWSVSPDDCDVADATDGVFDFLDYVTRNGGTREDVPERAKFKLPDKIKKGERDNVLFKYAAHLRAIGRSDEEIRDAVAGANVTRCATPLDSRDVARIVKSACRYERGESNDADGAPSIGNPGGGTDKRRAGAADGVRGPRGGILTNELAKAVMAKNHARIIDGAPAVWTGDHWEFGKRAIARAALAIADDAKTQDRNEVFNYIQAQAPHVESDEAFDGRFYVQFADATYDVLADEVVEPTPDMFILGKLPVKLDLMAAPNLADEFVRSLSGGDEVVERAMWEVLGCCMCSKQAAQKAFMLIGRAGGAEGRASNGKSTFINWSRSIVGSANVSSLDISTLGDKFNAGMVVGKLANMGDDIPDGFLDGKELSNFKKAVTGDSIYTDVKNGEGFTFRPSATMVFSMNAVPRLSDTTEGVFRRLAFIPFKSRFAPGVEGYDPNLAAKLSAREVRERGAVLGLIALQRVLRNGLTAIPDMQEEVAEVRRSNDSVARWIYDADLTAADVDGRSTNEMYRRYRDWCEDNGERSPFAHQTFTKSMADKTFWEVAGGCRMETVKAKLGGKTTRVFRVLSGI